MNYYHNHTQLQLHTMVSREVAINPKNMVFLKDIVPAAQNSINTEFIVLDKKRIEGQKKTCLALVADETAAVHFQFWNDECEAFEAGDIVRLTNGVFLEDMNKFVLRSGKKGKIEKVGEFTMAFVETPNMSEIPWVRRPINSNKYVQPFSVSTHSTIFPPMS